MTKVACFIYLSFLLLVWISGYWLLLLDGARERDFMSRFYAKNILPRAENVIFDAERESWTSVVIVRSPHARRTLLARVG